MTQNLASSLTAKLEAEAKLMQQHRANIELFQQNTDNMLSDAEQSLYSLQTNAQRTTEIVTQQASQAQQSLNSVKLASNNLADLIEKQTKETATLLNQQAQQLQQVKAQYQQIKEQSQQLSDTSRDIGETAKIKKALFTSIMVLASIALILLILSISLGYVSKSKYNDISEMQNKVEYLKSQGGSMITTTCGGKLCVELDPNYLDKNYSLDKGTRPLAIVREVR